MVDLQVGQVGWAQRSPQLQIWSHPKVCHQSNELLVSVRVPLRYLSAQSLNCGAPISSANANREEQRSDVRSTSRLKHAGFLDDRGPVRKEVSFVDVRARNFRQWLSEFFLESCGGLHNI